MTFMAKGFKTTYGNNIAVDVLNSFTDYVLITQPEPWALVKDSVVNKPREIVLAGELSPEYLNNLADSMPKTTIVGLGGGSAMDTAKWIHWRRDLSLFQIPSLPSVDACFTRMSALRDKGGVRYEGDSVPEMVYVDFELFRSAPRPMVTSGIGDVLSCNTAWFDWKFAADNDQDEFGWTEEMPKVSLTYLEELYSCAPGINEMTDDGLRRLMELLRDIGWRCHEFKHARFEEGSEHFFAYAFEEVTGRTILHGELVTVGTLLMSYFQGNDYERVKDIVLRAGTRHTLDELKISEKELIDSVRQLASYTREQKHWYSHAMFLDLKNVDDSKIIELINF